MHKRKIFTPKQIAEARRMKAAGMPWTKIAERFGVSDECMRRHAKPGYRERRNGHAAASWANRSGDKWTEEETAKLMRLHHENWSWDYIITQLPGRSKQACQVRVHYQTYGREYPKRSKEERLALRVPDQPRTDLTGIICGDPAPGRSALEQTPRRRRPISLAPISMGASA